MPEKPPENCRRTSGELPENAWRTSQESPEFLRRTPGEPPKNCRRIFREYLENLQKIAGNARRIACRIMRGESQENCLRSSGDLPENRWRMPGLGKYQNMKSCYLNRFGRITGSGVNSPFSTDPEPHCTKII